MPISPLLVLLVSNVKQTYRKSWAGNLLRWSDLTLDRSFKVKRGQPNLKVLITHLLLVLEVCNVKPTYRKSLAGNLLMWSDLTLCWVSSDVFRFDLGPLLQGQTRIENLKVFISRLLLVPEAYNVKPTFRKTWDGNLLMWSDLTLSPSFKVR